jgi:hypothetical protein
VVRTTVALEDRFGDGSVVVGRAKRICNPADKLREDPSAVSAPDHLVAYEINQATGFIPVKDLHVVNQFQDVRLNLARPDYMMVPSAKSIGTTVPGAITPAINHYKCYTVTHARFRLGDVPVTDQFGSLSLDIKRPARFCAAASKNGEPVLDSNAHLLCYTVGPATGSPRFKGLPAISTTNQFGSNQFRVFGARELCVPTTISIDD